jgi:hypothetical protein
MHASLFLAGTSMQRTRHLLVTVRLNGTELCADYCGQTGRLRILLGKAVVREWFPPNSWIAVASVAGARNWGTRPDSDELQTLLKSQASLLRIG